MIMRARKYKVLLVNPPSVCLIPDNRQECSFYDYLLASEPDHDHLPGEHLGIEYIASYMDIKRPLVETILLNACVERHTNIQQTYDVIKSYGEFDVVGFSGPYNVFEEILWLASQIKTHYPNTKIVYGQYFASLNYKQILFKYPVFDYICVGDGEIPFERFIAYLNDEIKLEEIPSFAYIKDGVCILNHIKYDHSELLQIIPRRDYASKVLDAGLCLSIAASRGCPYRCSFCVSGSLMSKGDCYSTYILRDPKSVVDELEQMVIDYGIDRVVFVDDTFAAGSLRAKEQAKEIALEIIKRKLQISIMIDTRVDCIDESLFQLLKRAGVSKAFVGIESVSSSALGIYNKGYKQQNVKSQLSILQQLGIKVIPGIINFNPQSTISEIKHNVDFILELNIDYNIKLSNSFIPYPGTILTNKYIESGNVIGEFPQYSVIYNYQNVLALQRYFVLFNKEYASIRDTCMSQEKIEKLEKISKNFLKKMLDIAQLENYTNLFKIYFDKTIDTLHTI